jgi:ribulose-phosphate 3-epimerase
MAQLNAYKAEQDRMSAQQMPPFMGFFPGAFGDNFAAGGNVQGYNLGGYSDGGRLLKGPGDGVSDDIPAVIGDRQPARLADGEFVIPARIVSEIGNGSTDAGAKRLHVDIFDGVFLDSPLAFTFGPQMVAAIRKCNKDTILDLHVCVDRPARYIEAMKEAGGNVFIFQWEAIQDEENPTLAASTIAQSVVDHGMDCGISINPSTGVEAIFDLLKSGLISAVDVLSVEPGFGGQSFQEVAVDKINKLVQFRDEHDEINYEIIVDGGINGETAAKVCNADILVAGTYLFQHSESFQRGIEQLMDVCHSIQDRYS